MPLREVASSVASPAPWLVAFAGSSGGLQALHRILGGLPAEFPAAVAVVQHRMAANEHMLGELLSRWTTLRVRDAVEGDVLESGTVYIAPADRHMKITRDRTVGLARGDAIHHVRSSADPLFTSAAMVYGARFIAVVLTGGNGDGSDGIRHVRTWNGTVIAQDPASASNDEMPRHAIATGVVDLVVPLEDIARTIMQLVSATNEPVAETA